MSKKTEVFKTVLDQFETEEIRAYCKDMIELMPDYNFSIPSSTSLKYHNATQCQPGGQSYHVLMAGTIMNYILGLKYMKEKYPMPKKRDCMRTAILLHDAHKTGGGQYTVHEHPILAQKWIEETHVEHDIDDRLKKYIGRLCASHSGEWISSNKSNVILPEPENDEQMLVHICDILSSRSNIDMIYSPEQTAAIQACLALSSPDVYIFEWGKYKGKTITDVSKDDPSYIKWLRDKSDMGQQEPLKSLLAKL